MVSNTSPSRAVALVKMSPAGRFAAYAEAVRRVNGGSKHRVSLVERGAFVSWTAEHQADRICELEEMEP